MSEQLNINSFVSSYRSGYRPLYHLEKKARWLPGYFTIQSAISPIATIAQCSYLKIHLVDEARVAPLLKHLGCFRHSWTGEPWSMWMLSYIFVANSIFGQFYKGGLFSLMARRLMGISQYGG